VDGKSDWLISIMKDFDWLQVHVNNSFKNSSVKGPRAQGDNEYKGQTHVTNSIIDFFEFLFFYA
jgi:hypothetical protein